MHPEARVRILALEVEKPEASSDAFQPFLVDEARKVWDLQQEDFIREIYFRADRSSAVLLLECADLDEAKARLAELPLVSAGLIAFDLIPLIPYPGFSRLFHSH
jgi:hypothetical protein